MITTKLTGNLGNHIAYYVSVRAIAEKLGYSWGFDPIPSYDYYNGAQQMSFMNIDYGEFPNNIQNTYKELELRYNDHGDNVDVRPFDENVFNIVDDSELFGVFQAPEYFYDRISDVKKWLSIKDEVINEAKSLITLDDNTCLINFRGGEYKHHPGLIIRAEYYHRCIERMREINPEMKFIVITDDVECATQYLPGFPIHHFSIAIDYTLLNQTKYAILSNSSFPIFAMLTNENIKKVIAPYCWARWNGSEGYWATAQNIYPGWSYLDRDGVVKDYEQCKAEALNWLNTYRGKLT